MFSTTDLTNTRVKSMINIVYRKEKDLNNKNTKLKIIQVKLKNKILLVITV